MNTQQSYVGRGDSSPNSSPAANSGPQTSLTASERRAEMLRLVGRKQKQLLDLVDTFGDLGEVNPIEIVNDLLYHWLTTPVCDLADEGNRFKLKSALSLVTFLSDLKNDMASISYFEGIVEREEVNRG